MAGGNGTIFTLPVKKAKGEGPHFTGTKKGHRSLGPPPPPGDTRAMFTFFWDHSRHGYFVKILYKGASTHPNAYISLDRFWS